jgi:hypothetical protein
MFVASAAVGRRGAMTATPMPSPLAPPPEIPAGLDTGAGDQPDAGMLAVANAALRGGFVLLPRTLLHAPGLSRDAKLLYAVLLSYAWQQGSCFPGAERLQHDLGCGKNQVTRYLQELEHAGLVSRRRRGQGKTTLYTLHDPPTAPTPNGQAAGRPAADSPRRGGQSPRTGEPRLPKSGNQAAPKRGAEQDSGERDSAEHQHPAPPAPPAPLDPPGPLAPTAPPAQEATGAGDDDVLALLISRGITRRIAQALVKAHAGEAIRQQVAWQPYRPPAKRPAGALVQAIRDAWPPPPAWIDAQEHAAAVARQAEEETRRRAAAEARRRAWEQKPPEERIAGRLQFWLLGQRRKGREPTEAEVAAKRAAFLIQLAAPAEASGGEQEGRP